MPDQMFSQGGRREDGHDEGDSWGKRMGITVAAALPFDKDCNLESF